METRLLDNLTDIQKRVFGLYNVVVTDNMLSEGYKLKLEEDLNSCKSFAEVNLVRTRILAIEDYRRQRINQILEITSDGKISSIVKDENGNIDYEFYDFLDEMKEVNKVK